MGTAADVSVSDKGLARRAERKIIGQRGREGGRAVLWMPA